MNQSAMQQFIDARSRASLTLSIYRSQSVEDPSRLEDAVDALCDDTRAAFHTNISRIKRKIVETIGLEAAKAYIIYRHTDGRYRIDKNNVKYETVSK